MHYIIYKTTNNLNKKFYIGCHQTSDINDSYLGSGKHLKRAIKKYGIDNFTKEILFIFDNKEEMFLKEKEIVNKELVIDNATYNLKIGGSGGNPGIVGAFLGRSHSEESKNKIREKALLQITTDKKKERLSCNHWSKAEPDKQREHARLAGIKRGDMYKDMPELKTKISESLKGRTQNKIECPHCKRIGGERAMKRHHFDNCKASDSRREDGLQNHLIGFDTLR